MDFLINSKPLYVSAGPCWKIYKFHFIEILKNPVVFQINWRIDITERYSNGIGPRKTKCEGSQHDKNLKNGKDITELLGLRRAN